MRLRRRLVLYWGNMDTLERASWVASWIMLFVVIGILYIVLVK